VPLRQCHQAVPVEGRPQLCGLGGQGQAAGGMWGRAQPVKLGTSGQARLGRAAQGSAAQGRKVRHRTSSCSRSREAGQDAQQQESTGENNRKIRVGKSRRKRAWLLSPASRLTCGDGFVHKAASGGAPPEGNVPLRHTHTGVGWGGMGAVEAGCLGDAWGGVVGEGRFCGTCGDEAMVAALASALPLTPRPSPCSPTSG